jgi:hypothetical protein
LGDFGKGSAHAYSNAVRAEKFQLIYGVEQQEALAVKQSKAGLIADTAQLVIQKHLAMIS